MVIDPLKELLKSPIKRLIIHCKLASLANFARRESYTPWPMRDVKDDELIEKVANKSYSVTQLQLLIEIYDQLESYFFLIVEKAITLFEKSKK
jgi:hypothetical protein